LRFVNVNTIAYHSVQILSLAFEQHNGLKNENQVIRIWGKHTVACQEWIIITMADFICTATHSRMTLTRLALK